MNKEYENLRKASFVMEDSLSDEQFGKWFRAGLKKTKDVSFNMLCEYLPEYDMWIFTPKG